MPVLIMLCPQISTTGSAGTDIPSNNVRNIVLLARVSILSARFRGLDALYTTFTGILRLEALGLL